MGTKIAVQCATFFVWWAAGHLASKPRKIWKFRPKVLSQLPGTGKYTQDDETLDIAESAQEWLLNCIEHNFSGGHRLVAAHFTNSETW